MTQIATEWKFILSMDEIRKVAEEAKLPFFLGVSGWLKEFIGYTFTKLPPDH
jgi:hypothetical protein